jgi:catalase (peroxidase I)
VAWHSSGTYSVEDGSGGSDGATMRFEPEKSDPANAGLHIVRDMLHGVKKAHPEISEADLWTFAGCVAIEFMGGPEVPHRFGRTDKPNGSFCPPVGRIPDASKGADHVRQFFRRMGFNDRETVALSGMCVCVCVCVYT